MTADERLIAYLDGELPPAERVRFEAEMAADPALARQVARQRALAARIAGAYVPVLSEPVPPRLIAVASAANDRGPGWPRVAKRAPTWLAMAACLLVGVLAGRALWPESGALTAQGGALVARSGLAKALTTQLAADSGPIQVGLSFRARDGRYCRTFQSPADRLAGLACHDGARWVADATFAWTAPTQPTFRTAASATPPAVLAAVDAMISGDAFDAEQERAARDVGWRRSTR
jgi:hypothetical protein